MARPRPDVAEVARRHGPALLERLGRSLTSEQRRTLRDIARCRTAALGGHIRACGRCGHRQVVYNSCRNRHCPKCQAGDAARWLSARTEDLLPVEYYHVVFTLPAALNPLARRNPRVVYGLLFRSVAATLQQIAADPRHLGAEIGFVAVLHTWGQTLQLHPHVHCIVPGGGLSPDGTRWIACARGFFLPVRVLGRVFRGKFLAELRAAFARGEVTVPGTTPGAAGGEFRQLLGVAARTDWVVYAKPPFGGPASVLKYLARYTHRTAISDSRLRSLQGDRVTFAYRDYARGGRRRTMTLAGVEFLRRLLLHVLPTGFVRIRHYGFLANRHRRAKLALCRRLLGATVAAEPSSPPGVIALVVGVPAPEPDWVCPACGLGRMRPVEFLPPVPIRSGGCALRVPAAVRIDTS